VFQSLLCTSSFLFFWLFWCCCSLCCSEFSSPQISSAEQTHHAAKTRFSSLVFSQPPCPVIRFVLRSRVDTPRLRSCVLQSSCPPRGSHFIPGRTPVLVYCSSCFFRENNNLKSCCFCVPQAVSVASILILFYLFT
jgi:hypothetical protein